MVQILGFPHLAYMSSEPCLTCKVPWSAAGPEWVVSVRYLAAPGRPGDYGTVHVACACRDFVLTSDDALALLGESS